MRVLEEITPDELARDYRILSGVQDLLLKLPEGSQGLGLRVKPQEAVLVYPVSGVEFTAVEQLRGLTWYEVDLDTSGLAGAKLLKGEAIRGVLNEIQEELEAEG